MVYSEADKKVYMGGYNKKVTVLNLNLDGFNSWRNIMQNEQILG